MNRVNRDGAYGRPRLKGLRVVSSLLATLFLAGAVSCGDGSEHRAAASTAIYVGVGGDDSHACAVIVDGSVRCWGSDANHQHAKRSTNGAPAIVHGVADATRVSAGEANACAVIRDGSVECWDQDSFWTGKAAPVKGLSDATQISVGSNDYCAARSGGKVSCWELYPLVFGPGGLGHTAINKVPTEVAGLP